MREITAYVGHEYLSAGQTEQAAVFAKLIAPDEYSARLRLKWDDPIWGKPGVLIVSNVRTEKRATKWGQIKFWVATLGSGVPAA